MTRSAAKQAVGAPSLAAEVDAAVGSPVAYGGLRAVLGALRERAPGPFGRAAKRSPAEMERLFPGTQPAAADISDLALSPSERRLHKESEQVFRILTVGARLIVESLEESDAVLHVQGAGASDLVSLRGLMRAVEWSRMRGLEGRIRFTGWSQRRHHAPAQFEKRRREAIDAIRVRMRLPIDERPDGPERCLPLEAPVDLEGRYLAHVLDAKADPAHRIAAALLATRTCFFSTNHEGALLACEKALGLLDTHPGEALVGRIDQAWGLLDEGFATPAVELDRQDLESLPEIRAVLLRQMGVVHAFSGEFHPALACFERALELDLCPERRAELLNYHAICLAKRLGHGDLALEGLRQALGLVLDGASPRARLQQAWIRNGMALVYWGRRQFPEAYEQVKHAVAAVGDLHDPAATHARINLLSNVSVLQETDGKFDAALRTWRKFERTASSWGANFQKHHRYRLAGLTFKLGEQEAALGWYAEAFEKALELGDQFNAHAISLELGANGLATRNLADAARWFRHAVLAAGEMGEPWALSLALAGGQLAQAGKDFGPARDAALASSTYPEHVARLLAALERGDGRDLAAQLPTPRTKLNRPFEPVNV